MKTLTFRSKVDLWLGAVLALVAGSTIWGAVTSGEWLSLAIVAAVFVLVLMPIRYELQADALVVRSGLIRYRRPYADITAATANRSLFSAPALSLDRLLIRSGSRFGVNISPADREAFLAALAERAPQLVSDGKGGLSGARRPHRSVLRCPRG